MEKVQKNVSASCFGVRRQFAEFGSSMLRKKSHFSAKIKKIFVPKSRSDLRSLTEHQDACGRRRGGLK